MKDKSIKILTKENILLGKGSKSKALLNDWININSNGYIAFKGYLLSLSINLKLGYSKGDSTFS